MGRAGGGVGRGGWKAPGRKRGSGEPGLVSVLEGCVFSESCPALPCLSSLPSLCTLVCGAILAPLSVSPALWELGPMFSLLWV